MDDCAGLQTTSSIRLPEMDTCRATALACDSLCALQPQPLFGMRHRMNLEADHHAPLSGLESRAIPGRVIRADSKFLGPPSSPSD
jgi:hypothetical protein